MCKDREILNVTFVASPATVRIIGLDNCKRFRSSELVTRRVRYRRAGIAK